MHQLRFRRDEQLPPTQGTVPRAIKGRAKENVQPQLGQSLQRSPTNHAQPQERVKSLRQQFTGCRQSFSGGDTATKLHASALMHTSFLRRCPFDMIGRLGLVCKAFRSRILEGEDGWRLICASLADSAKLYCPDPVDGQWRRLFFDQIWPARSVWKQKLAHYSSSLDRTRTVPRIH